MKKIVHQRQVDIANYLLTAYQKSIGFEGELMSKKFFDERTDQSEVKARIVQKYLFVWANVVMGAAERMGTPIAYIDLYAGPGRYKDGAASTPLLILEQAIANPRIAKIPSFNGFCCFTE